MPVVIPPWLDINPRDFISAATAGGHLGSEIANRRTEAAIAGARNRAGLEEAQLRANVEMSGRAGEQALEGARLQQAGSQQAAERALREWEVQQQIKHQQDALTAENDRAKNSLAERNQYGNSVLDIRREANRIAQERADNTASKPNPSDFTTVSEHTKETPASKTYHVTEPEIFNLFSKNTPGKTFDTTNAVDLANLPRSSNITTNTIPGTGIPSRTITRRVPIGANPYTLQIPGDNTPAPQAPAAHVNYLKANPTADVVSQFEQKYGPGSASQYLSDPAAPDESQFAPDSSTDGAGY